MEKVQALKCDYCSKLYQLERFAKAHEKSCTKNPDNFRICFGCDHIEKKLHKIHESNEYGEFKNVVDILYCSKIKSFLYPPKVEHKGNAFELGDELNEPMKRDCEHFKAEEIY